MKLAIGNGEGLASDGTPSGKKLAPVGGSHLGQESVGSHSFDFARLIGHFCHDQRLLAIVSKLCSIIIRNFENRVNHFLSDPFSIKRASQNLLRRDFPGFPPRLPRIHPPVESGGRGMCGKPGLRAIFSAFFSTFPCENRFILWNLSTFFVENFLLTFYMVMV